MGSHMQSPSVSDWRTLPSDLLNTWKLVRSGRTRDLEDENFDLSDKKIEDSHGPLSHRTGMAHRSKIRRLLYAIFTVLSLVWYLIPRQGRPVRTKELHQLAYLDALRGWMSLIVLIGHIMNKSWRWLPEFVFSTPGLQFPFRGAYVCLFVFFWISGYVVSYRALGFVHAKQPQKMLDTIASTVFRRHFRLFLPALPFTFIVAVGAQMGIVTPDESQRTDAKADMTDAFIKDSPYWWWVVDAVRLMNPFADVRGYHNGAFGSRILGPLWSLCTEFRSTLMLCIFLVAAHKIPFHKRNRLILACIPIFFYYESEWAAMAFTGMWFADQRQHKIHQEKARSYLLVASPGQSSDGVTKLPLVTGLDDQSLNKKGDVPLTTTRTSATSSELHTSLDSRIRSSYKKYETVILYAVFIYSFFIIFDPDERERSKYFPNALIKKIEPRWWAHRSQLSLHLCFGAILMLYPIDRLPSLQRPLRTAFSQYLGELSFGIYVTHYVVKWIIWERFILYFERRKLDHTVPHRMIPAFIIMTTAVLWAAELFRLIDTQVVIFCKWTEDQMFE